MAMAETPQHFFKVILASTLEDKKLRIPEKFVRKFGDELSVFATLTVPDGRVWQVGLSSEWGKFWFLDGWNDFVEYYSIRVGYFLVFRYEKCSKFHVLIFDTTVCEIGYPYHFKEPKIEQNSVQEIENEDYREISGSPNRNPRVAANLDSSRSKHECERWSEKCKVEELVQINETNHVRELKPGQSKRSKICNTQGNLHHRKHSNRNAQDRKLKATQIEEEKELLALLESKGIVLSRNYRVSSAKESERIFSIAKSLNPKYPSFMLFMRESHLHSSRVYLPAKFVNKHLTQGATHIILQVSNGREWPVQIGWKDSACHTKKGWTEFVKNMKLKAEDVCLFELMKREDLLLKVSVL